MSPLRGATGIRPQPGTGFGTGRCAPRAGSWPGHSAAGPPPEGTARFRYGGGEGGSRRRLDAGMHIAVLGTWIALVPVAMIFAGLIVTNLALQGAAATRAHLPLPRVLGLGTVALLLATLALQCARSAARTGLAGRRWIAAALGGGGSFVLALVRAWQELIASGFGPGTSPQASFFYVLTGTYGIHVLGGLTILTALFRWPSRGWRGTPLEVALQAAAIYWHFMAGVWLVLLAVMLGSR